MIVRAYYADKAPADRGVEPVDLEQPTVYLSGEHIDDIDLTPKQCHTLIAALTAVNAAYAPATPAERPDQADERRPPRRPRGQSSGRAQA